MPRRACERAGRAQLTVGRHVLVIEQSPEMTTGEHDRHCPSLNHLAFRPGGRSRVDVLATRVPDNGWTLMFSDRHPHAGGPNHHAAYLTNTGGYEVELVAPNP